MQNEVIVEEEKYYHTKCFKCKNNIYYKDIGYFCEKCNILYNTCSNMKCQKIIDKLKYLQRYMILKEWDVNINLNLPYLKGDYIKPGQKYKWQCSKCHKIQITKNIIE